MKSNDNRFQKEISILVKTIKLFHSEDKYFFTLLAFKAILETARYFITLIMSALIIDELIGSQEVSMFIIYVSIILGANFLLKMGADYIARMQTAKSRILRKKIHSRISEKILTADFEYIDSPRLHNLRQKFLEYDNMSGTVYQISFEINKFFSAILDVAVSVTLSVALFKPAVGLAADAFTRTVNSPYWVILMAFMIVCLILIQKRESKKVGELQMIVMNKGMSINRIGHYMQYDLCGDYKHGKDLRMYNMDKLVEKFTDTFVYSIKEFLTEFNNNRVKQLSAGTVVNGIFIGLIYMLVVLKAFISAITIGSIMKFVGAIQRLSTGISNLLVGISELRVSSQFLDFIHQLLELPDIKYHGTIPVEKREDHEYEIEFKNVSFKYPVTEEYVLKNVSLKLTIGERLAVVGMNGAGKTTFIKLLSRLYDPNEGEILLNGINIKKYDYEEYLSLFSVVFQDFQLFSFEMGQNVASDTKLDENKALECLNKAGLEEKMKKLPKGIHTMLNKDFDKNGVDFSGGELQKMAIARALYKDAPIIILDEPTASLDPISEFEIYTKFDHLVGDKTAIYISHRLSSCRFCHDIIVFHEGQIIQRGSHEELVEDMKGKYFELWNAQAQYYNGDKQAV